MEINELKQALEYHYLIKADHLLSEDGLFPYSDRDIELVCGSLVTVRNDTLQVVHLTVKQYIKSSSGPTALLLPTETKSANLELTLACLSFLKHECAEPIVELFPQRPFEVLEDTLDLQLSFFESPFLEYACFSWFVHLTDCTAIDALEACRFCYLTFDSPSTFGWIESCLALQPFSVPRLLIALEDVRHWIEIWQLDENLAEDSSLSFVSKWCATMEQVLEEHGPVIEEQISEIYYLDLALIFAAQGLSDTYEKHGGLIRREKCSRYPTEKVPRLGRNIIPPNRRIGEASRVFIDPVSPGVFVYESNRDVFIWTNKRLDDPPVLFAQSASSGRRLAPATGPESQRDSYNKWITTLGYAMSKDSRHLGIVYSDRAAKSLFILIWEIETALDFTRRIRASSWARIIHSSVMDEEPIARLWSKNCITFDDDGVCITPNGLFRTASEARVFVPDNPLQRLLAKATHCFSENSSVSYSGDGKSLFVFSGKDTITVTKFTLPRLEVSFRIPPLQVTLDHSVISPNGRYIASPSSEHGSRGMIMLIDSLLRTNFWCLALANSDLKLFFVNEEEFIAWSSDWNELHIFYYVALPDNVRLRASGKCVCSDRLSSSNRLYVSGDHKIAHVITESGEIQRIKLGDEIEFLDAPDEVEEYPTRSNFLSQDGTRWASVYDYGDKAQVQIQTVLNPDELPRCFELQRTSPLCDYPSKFLGMSMDLSILVLDGDVYSVGDPNIGEKALTPRILKLPIELGVTETEALASPRRCLVDSSNSYVAFFRQTFLSNLADAFVLFGINFDETSSLRLQPALPEDMSETSSHFHPSLPLLLLGFSLISEAATLGRPSSKQNFLPYHVVIINMNTMSIRAVEFKQVPDLMSRSVRCKSYQPDVLTVIQRFESG